MRQDDQQAILRRISRHLAEGSTDMAPEPYRNGIDAYTDADRAARERDLLFSREALFLAMSCDVPAPGDYLCVDAAGVPLLLVRGDDGVLRCFFNVCRHRGGRVAEGRGNGARVFTCPYHAWSYGLDGGLAGQPTAEGFAGIDRCTLSLTQVPVAEKYGLIFARPTPGDPVDVDVVLDGAEAELAAYGLETYHHFETREMTRPMNWKLVVDTFLEAYHIPALHKKTIAPLILGSPAIYDTFGRNGRLIGVRRSIADLENTPEPERSLLPHATILYILHPNTVLIHQVDHVETWQIFPAGNGVDEAHMRISLYAPAPVETDKARDYWRANLDLLIDVTSREDFVLGGQIQQGFNTQAQDSVIYGRNEPGLIHFHHTLKQALGIAD
jgi:phenylpropionate dioxygenase-like ring-hydroxylating dioxygenase large terminal subunit